MTQFVFANGVQTTLAAAITATDTTLVVASTANLPTIAAGQQCPAVLGTLALFEIVYITNINSSTLTITRGQENTAAQSWGLGTQFEISVTAGSIAAAQIIGTLGGVLTGTLPNPGMGSGVVTGTNIASGTVTEGNMASGAIHRAQLSTATASGSIGMAANGSSGIYTLTGGTYSWYTYSASADGSTTYANADWVSLGGGNLASTTPGALEFVNLTGGGFTNTAYVKENYINSSPPYNFGEAFVYVAYDKDGKIVGISAALDPCWAHHGSHSIVPTHRSLSGKPMIMLDSLDGKILADALKDPAIKRAYLKGELEITQEEHEITIAYKDQDKEEYPHPFGSDSVARVVLMHPDSPCNNRITDLLKKGFASEIVKLIEDGDLIFKGTGVMHPYAPSTVLAVRAKVR